ncbi:membrane protein [Bacteroidia bacterium]|nr:membrane protein [Bacteroidia bacterium]
MKEAVFIRQNKEKWEGYERSLHAIGQQSPDVLADIYIDVTNDLSFAQSHYPSSPVSRYLNGLSAKLHQFIYRKKKENFSRIVTFWTREVPEVMYHTRKELLYSFLIFVISMLTGAFSAANDDAYARLIMGDQYVDMTLANIANDDPMAVYKSMDEGIRFFGITINNIRVSFFAFIAGIFTSIATAYMLIQNGIMLGSFHYVFYEHGVLLDSLLAVWIHGTLEISAIIVAGAAGITMGNGWLFPKTYSRLVSFQRSARRGVKIVIGTVPLFIIAGFLESFVTRHTEFPTVVRLLIILLSLSVVVFYYIVYPRKLKIKTI